MRTKILKDANGNRIGMPRVAGLRQNVFADLSGPGDPNLFAGERFGNLKYTIPVPPGKYAVTFYMSEPWFGPNHPGGGGAGSRLFDIMCNGVALVRDLDVFQRAGGADRQFIQT